MPWHRKQRTVSPTVSRFTDQGKRTLSLAVTYGSGFGAILLEHLFLALAVQDVALIESIQLQLPDSRAVPTDRFPESPLVSRAFLEVVFEYTPSGGGAIDNRVLAAALRRYLERWDPVSNGRYLSLRGLAFSESDRELLRALKLV